MLITISTLVVICYTVYFVIKVHPKKQLVNQMFGKSISMALGMVSSLTIGVLIASLLHGQLAISTILAVVVSAVVAYFISTLFGFLAVIESLAASLMGSTMGAMLAEMLPTSDISFLLIFMDVIYLTSIIATVEFIHKKLIEKETTPVRVTKPYSFVLMLTLSFLLIGMATFLDSNHTENKQDMSTHNHHMKMNEE
ncbi:hypothetical protein [Priestia aryabhattai]|uniref:hypothetical protein n=1 Tax=Priestia aryabhattai TaxID=412384 RepID=UPI003CF206F1